MNDMFVCRSRYSDEMAPLKDDDGQQPSFLSHRSKVSAIRLLACSDDRMWLYNNHATCGCSDSQWQFACSTGHAGCSAWQKARGDARLLVLLIVLLAFDLGRTFVWFSQQADELQAVGSECALGSAGNS